ncbi:MAG: hypothetical protein V1891_01720 [bacterium]
MKEKIKISFFKIVAIISVLAILVPATSYASYTLTLEVPSETVENFINKAIGYLTNFSLQKAFSSAVDKFELKCDECNKKIDTKVENAKTLFNSRVEEIQTNFENRKQNIKNKYTK